MLCFAVVEVASDKGMPQVVARWGRDPVACSAYGEEGFALARKSGRVEVLNPVNGVRLAEVVVPTSISERVNGNREDASDAVCGLHLFKKNSIWGTAVLTCTEQGVAAIQRISFPADDEDMGVSNDGDEDMGVSTSSQVSSDAIVWSVADSGSVCCLRVDGSERYAIFGGKGVEVSMWDLEKRTRIWSAKNPRRDNLGLIAPAFVTALAFLSVKDHRKFVVGTGHHQIRLYDTGAQRRPMLMFDYGESPIKSIAPGGDGNTVYVGSGSGDLACFDMRTGQNVGGFKGKISGSVRSVVLHPTLPIVASCGLDRYLRIHHSRTRQLLSMLFLKQQLISVVFDTSADKSVPPTSGSSNKENSNAAEAKPASKTGTEKEGRTDKKKRSREELKDFAVPSQNLVKIKKKSAVVPNIETKQEKSSRKVRKSKGSGP
uniref:Ribosome biogenesis protein NSA1 n=1 Tax=Physcomitrium patens TaxID=3218 RepID=A0A7I4AKR3_PHYPA